jgi:hypothetical protein
MEEGIAGNELYDNDYFRAGCEGLNKPREQLRDFLSHGNVELLRKLYSLEALKAEAAKAKELGCEALYLDPGWDTGPSHHVWDADRLGSVESFVELMRKEYGLKTSMDDLLSGRAKSLYYYSLAYSIPLYLHVGLKTDNTNALVFWWYASTCRHLGVGGRPQDPAVWDAQKAAMRAYLPLKLFYARGTFYGLDETAHAHTLPQARASVMNIFNLTDQPQIRALTFTLSEIGLPAGVATVENAAAEQHGGTITVRVPVPAFGHALVKLGVQENAARPLFRKAGTGQVEDFAGVPPAGAFDVVNTGAAFLMVAFEPNASARFFPPVVRIPPSGQTSVRLEVKPGVEWFALRDAVASSAAPFQTHPHRYRSCSESETVVCVPVAPGLYAAMQARAKSIVNGSTTLLTDKEMPAGTTICTPGPYYRDAGLFARDLLFQLEGSGRDVTAQEVRQAVDLMALKQLTENRKVGEYTFPKGAIPDHVYPDGRYAWGPGKHFGDVPGHFNRPSMDQAMCFITLAWHYGYKAGWDAAWQTWFKAKAARFDDAWNSVPRNPKTGLVTQWTTPGRELPQRGRAHRFCRWRFRNPQVARRAHDATHGHRATIGEHQFA